ncbi:MAG TPA: hypothetical protein VGB61_07875 [Pyrinomonadaceae bacterium]|jgi:hypothetical protein
MASPLPIAKAKDLLVDWRNRATAQNRHADAFLAAGAAQMADRCTERAMIYRECANELDAACGRVS